MNEAINDSSKLVAQAIESLKAEIVRPLPKNWNSKTNIEEVIELLEKTLDKLSPVIGQ